MPKTQDSPIGSIRQFEVVSIGDHISVEHSPPIKTNRSTTADKRLIDQSVIDLGQSLDIKPVANHDNDKNKIKVKFTVYVNDHSNVTEGANFWIGAGVIGRPKMVWVGQIKLTTTLSTPSVPFPKVDMTYSGDT